MSIKKIEFLRAYCHYNKMKKILITLWFSLIALCLAPISSATEVYISVDKDGNRVFSDKPSKESRIHKLKEISTIPAIKIPQKTTATQRTESVESVYQKLIIVTPAPESYVHRGEVGNFVVSAQLSSSLNIHDEAVLLFDGEELSSGHQLSWQINNADRGTHTLQVIVRQKDTKEVKISSSTQNVYVKR